VDFGPTKYNLNKRRQKMKVASNSMYDGGAPPMAVPIATPIGQAAGNGMQMFQHSAISVEQTMRGCFQECLGCEVRVSPCTHIPRIMGQLRRKQKKDSGPSICMTSWLFMWFGFLAFDSSNVFGWLCPFFRPRPSTRSTRGT
jgi:hypothetical protein